jgi:hypothetical protein
MLFKDTPVKVICVTAAVVLFFFHRMSALTERFFAVPLQVGVPAGLAIASAYPKSVRITLRGEKDAINPILEEDIAANVNLESHKSPGVFRATVQTEKRGTAMGVEPLEILVDPGEISFTLESLVERRVSVIPDIRGSPAYGYELTGYSLSPQNAVIRGAKSAVEAANALSTEQIDLTGHTADFAQRLKIALPNQFVKITGDTTVDFHATIKETVITKRFEGVSVTAVDLPVDLELKSPAGEGSIELRGGEIAVEAIKPEQLALLMECSGVRRPGIYTLRLTPQAPSNAIVSGFEPAEATVEIVASVR